MAKSKSKQQPGQVPGPNTVEELLKRDDITSLLEFISRKDLKKLVVVSVDSLGELSVHLSGGVSKWEAVGMLTDATEQALWNGRV